MFGNSSDEPTTFDVRDVFNDGLVQPSGIRTVLRRRFVRSRPSGYLATLVGEGKLDPQLAGEHRRGRRSRGGHAAATEPGRRRQVRSHARIATASTVTSFLTNIDQTHVRRHRGADGRSGRRRRCATMPVTPLFTMRRTVLALLTRGRDCRRSGPARLGPAGQRRPRPNLEGIWNSATATPLERPRELKDNRSSRREEAAQWEREVAKRNEEPPPGAAAKRTGTGTYNAVLPRVRDAHGEDAADLDRHRSCRWSHSRAHAGSGRGEAPAPRGLKKFENPEDLGLQDRCLTFLTAGPPMLPYSYNSNYQIVQTNDAVLVYAEMIHDARIIHLDGRPHLPRVIRFWSGRFDRPLGRRHAGGRHHQLQRRRRLLR